MPACAASSDRALTRSVVAQPIPHSLTVHAHLQVRVAPSGDKKQVRGQRVGPAPHGQYL